MDTCCPTYLILFFPPKPPDNTPNTSSMHAILEQEKLNGENFLDWYKNLSEVLEHEGKLYVFETILPQPPTVNSTMAEKAAYQKHEKDILDVTWLIFASMTPEIQLLHEDKNAFDMIETMKHRYQRESRKERFELSKTLFRCKFSSQKESVEVHVQEMIGYLERLENLGYPLCQELATDLILQSLPAGLSQHIMDTKWNEIDKSLPNLLQTIKDSEKEIGKISPDMSSITQGLALTGSVAEEGNCFHCGEKCHRTGGNCNVYSEEPQDNKCAGTRELQCATKNSHLIKSGEGKQEKNEAMKVMGEIRGEAVEGGGDKKAEVIMVRTLGADQPKHYDEDGVYCRRVRFHQVDLSEGKIKSNCFPSMLNRIGNGVMVRSDGGPAIYLIGGLTSSDQRCEPIDGAGSDNVYYKCGCRLDLQKEEEGRVWEQIDLPIKNRFIPCCASLFGKLYEFGFRDLHTPEVFDPSIGFWKELSPLPPELDGCEVSVGGVISDPANSRLLVHLYDGTLYAFYPGSGEWERVGSLVHWSYHNVVLVNNVLYIHHSESRVFLYAYDVSRRQLLKVTWSSRKCAYSNGYRVKVTNYAFDAMFYAGDGHFWMATWSPVDGDGGTSSAATMFFKFKVDRPDNGLHIVCTPVDIQCHDLQNSIEVTGFLLL